MCLLRKQSPALSCIYNFAAAWQGSLVWAVLGRLDLRRKFHPLASTFPSKTQAQAGKWTSSYYFLINYYSISASVSHASICKLRRNHQLQKWKFSVFSSRDMLCVSHWDYMLWQCKKYHSLTQHISWKCPEKEIANKFLLTGLEMEKALLLSLLSWLLSSTKILHFCYNHFIKLIVSCFLHFQLVITDTNISLFKLVPSKSKFHIFLFSTYIALSTVEKLAQNGRIFFALCPKATI